MDSADGAGGLASSRHVQTGFVVCDVFDAAPKDDLGSMEHPIFSLSTRPDRRVLSYTHNGVTIDVTPSVRGRATMHDKDVLIYCVSQLMAALNAGRDVSRTLRITAHELLVATNRDTSGDAYHRLREAFERLAGTRITTNLTTGGVETTQGFGLIEAWEIRRRSRGGRMISVSVTLSDWLYRAVLAKSVLTLSRDYFRLRKPLERRVYELARKHCGRQPAWTVSVEVLHRKAGSTAPRRVFRAALRKMISDANLPDYALTEEAGDLVRVTRAGRAEDRAPLFGAEVIERAKNAAPGQDVYALEQEWRGWWIETGRPRLSAPDRAFLAWLEGRVRRGN